MIRNAGWWSVLAMGCVVGDPDVERPDDAVAASVTPTVPLYGGTLTATSERVIVADPSVDRVFVVPASLTSPHATVQLPDGSEPFRVVVPADDPDRAFVVLRGTGRLVAIDLETAEVDASVPVCVEPRGVDADAELVAVACASGELVVLDRTLEPVGQVIVQDDLRDVVLDDDVVWLSTFRRASVLRMDRETWTVTDTVVPDFSETQQPFAEPRVAWRMRPLLTGDGVMLLHQGATDQPIDIEPEPGEPRPYGGGGLDCPEEDAVSTTHVTTVTRDGAQTSGAIAGPGPRYDFAIGEELGRRSVFVPNGKLTTSFGGFERGLVLSVFARTIAT
ncbi:MAG: hypothetical protein AAF211_16405, partial [Myxococcota bacterium]